MSLSAAKPTGQARVKRGVLAPWCKQVATIRTASLLAWCAYLALWMRSLGRPPGAPAPMWWCGPGMSVGSGSGSHPYELSRWLPMWGLMSTAMTVPSLLPAAQHVATNTFRRRRTCAVGAFVATYLLAWVLFGVGAGALVALAGGPAGALFTAALVAAAAYELTPAKRRALNRCHRSSPLPPHGIRGAVAVTRFAWIHASGCVASCWAAMIAMLTVPLVQPLAMAGFTVAMSYERLARRPRASTRRVAAGYAIVAAIVIAAGV